MSTGISRGLGLVEIRCTKLDVLSYLQSVEYQTDRESNNATRIPEMLGRFFFFYKMSQYSIQNRK